MYKRRTGLLGMTTLLGRGIRLETEMQSQHELTFSVCWSQPDCSFRRIFSELRSLLVAGVYARRKQMVPSLGCQRQDVSAQ
jgi:hypothetical protein